MIYYWEWSSSCRPPPEQAPQQLSAEAGFNLHISAKSSCLEAWPQSQSALAAAIGLQERGAVKQLKAIQVFLTVIKVQQPVLAMEFKK